MIQSFDDLPSNWVEISEPGQLSYYFNIETDEITFERPRPPQQPQQDDSSSSPPFEALRSLGNCVNRDMGDDEDNGHSHLNPDDKDPFTRFFDKVINSRELDEIFEYFFENGDGISDIDQIQRVRSTFILFLCCLF